MPESSLLAEYAAALDLADRIAEDLLALEADALADGLDVDLEKATDDWNAIMARYWTGNEAEDRFRARILIEALVMYGAKALRRVVRAEAAVAA